MRFAIMGLNARDAMLFKSMVRLLSHRLRYAWVYDDGQPDLAVVGAAPVQAHHPYVLHVSADGHSRPHHVALPLHANALEAALNAAGDAILALKASVTRHHAPAPPPDAPMQLLRWPPASVLAGQPARLRLATLMTGKPFTIAQLHERSGIELPACERFCQEALAAGILQPLSTAPPARPAERHAPAHSRGLLAQIRAKLGLGT
ncbi:hypothetical protein [Variovorax terrae]|uniref:Uncharacterized protein n=1 Tax=Variovorax terrae TaxID=2923278 RepID=A0A9X1VTE3_9BURK|nr:hypothetical protein [Variovorax terrae]MCJ0762973.1 hypothetical protein [Variovorax terrae]